MLRVQTSAMGWMKDSKATAMQGQAVRARDDGRVIFAPMMNSPWWKTGFSGAITDWALMIEAVESVGYRLEHWSVCTDQRGQPQAYPVFRLYQ